MNRGLKNEIGLLLGAAGILSFLAGRKKTGTLLAAGAVGVAISNIYEKQERLESKSVVITGGSRGLGFALAKEIVLQGGNVFILARNSEELERAKLLLQEVNPFVTVESYVCDVTNKFQLHKTVEAIIKKAGRVDIVINNAGEIMVGPFESMSEDDFRKQMELHTFAVLNMAQLFYAHFKQNKQGHIVNICSLGGRVAVPHMLPYDVSKFALSGLSQGLGAELHKDNITVTTIYPALMKTGSPIQAQFKGNHKKEFTWFAMSDYMPGLSVPAEVAAKKIIQGIKEKRSEVVFSTLAKARLWGSVLFPELMSWTLSFMNALMPKNNDRILKKGSEIRPEAKLFNQVFSQSAEETEKKYNQDQLH